MKAFKREFGKCNAKGVCNLDTYYLSLLNSLVYIGFAAGTFSSLVQKVLVYGHTPADFILSFFSRCLDRFFDQRSLWPPHDYLLYVLVGSLFSNNSCHVGRQPQ